jgi:hypothetical protein
MVRRPYRRAAARRNPARQPPDARDVIDAKSPRRRPAVGGLSAPSDTARNALRLDGKPASDDRVACPSGLLPAGQPCYDRLPRGPAGYLDALQTCARAGLRIPSEGDLALVFDHVGAPQRSQWTSGHTQSSDGKDTLGAWMSEDASRTLTLKYYVVSIRLLYRCVTTPTDAG